MNKKISYILQSAISQFLDYLIWILISQDGSPWLIYLQKKVKVGMNHLWDKDRYSAKIEFIIDNFIREYDITKANISVLRDANVLSEER